MIVLSLLLLAAAPAEPVPGAVAPTLALPPADAPTEGLQGALASEYAGGAGDALQICCMATWCTTALIDDCDLLSPAGKGVAAGTALVGGLAGFGLGYAAAVALTSPDGDKIILLPVGETIGADAESYATMALLSGAAGVIVGGAVGVVGALIVEPWVRFFFAAPRPRVPPPSIPPSRSPAPDAPGAPPPRP